nr:nuclear transport factor 2 family protein [Gordonia pseudamarae]
MNEQLRDLLDRQAICDVVARYCRAIDRRDFDLLRTCYHPGAVDVTPDSTAMSRTTSRGWNASCPSIR